MDYKKIRDELSKNKGMGLYKPEEIQYIEQPIGKAVHISSRSRTQEKIIEKSEKGAWADRLQCKICGSVFTRSCRTKHKRSRHHRDYLKFDTKIRKLMLEDDDNL